MVGDGWGAGWGGTLGVKCSARRRGVGVWCPQCHPLSVEHKSDL